MRWLLGGLVVSVVALLWVAVAVARHVRRQRRIPTEEIPGLDTAVLRLDELTENDQESKVAGSNVSEPNIPGSNVAGEKR